MRGNRARVIGLLAITQVASWGAIYYAFSVLAPDIQRESGWRSEVVYGAYSWSLLVAGLLSTPAGMLIDRFGGRWVMAGGSITAGLGLLLLGSAASIQVYFLAWTLLGGAMAFTLYESAFATINRQIPVGSRQAISTLTLFGGFASTVFWPLTAKLGTTLSWREIYDIYGMFQLLICLPAHLLLPRTSVHEIADQAPDQTVLAAKTVTLREALRHSIFWKLAFAFAANAFVFAALSVHLIPILQRFGHSVAVAVFFAALVGPMQVLGRIGEMALAKRITPQTAGKFTFGVLPVALATLALAGAQQWVAAIFCVLYGLSNGILTIVRGTVPQTLFGREHYGAISGAMAGPALAAKAAAPLVAAALLAVHDWHIALYVLFAGALVSLACYLAAIRAAGTNPESVEQDAETASG